MINKIFNIKNYERSLFKRHFISNVVLEARFSELHKKTIDDNIDFLKNSFNTFGFINFKPITQVQIQMNIDDNEPNSYKEDKDQVGYMFINDNKKCHLEITNDRIIYVTNNYDNFDAFREDIKNIIKTIEELKIENNIITHIGYRKINRLLINEVKSFEEVTKYFDKILFAPLRSEFLDYNNFTTYMDRIESKIDNCIAIIISKISKNALNEFSINLDFNIIIDKPENNEIFNYMEQMNNNIYSLFCNLISDDLKQEMNKEK